MSSLRFPLHLRLGTRMENAHYATGKDSLIIFLIVATVLRYFRIALKYINVY